METNIKKLILASDKQALLQVLKAIGLEKQRAYKRIDEIIEQEEAINRKLGEIYESTRTDL